MLPTKVHLVGSIALDSVDEVFRTAGRMLGRRIQRIPDGEPGGRRLWISWQYPLLRSLFFLKADTSQPHQTSGFLPLAISEGTDPAVIRFPELGYAREARASYQDLVAARSRGDIEPGIRFQVSLPTPFAVINPFVVPKDVPAVEPAYERAMLNEIAVICASIPHRELCIQWDVCIEMVLWDGRWPFLSNPFADLQAEIMSRMMRLAAAVPEDVELGFHLCYGDWEAKHFVEPEDSRKLVQFASALTAAVTRPIAYIHMPVPMNRSDNAYFEPLSGLKLAGTTELYLGLVHDDGAETTRARIRAAANYRSDFGIATECGIARSRAPELVRKLFGVHAEVSQEPSLTAAHSR